MSFLTVDSNVECSGCNDVRVDDDPEIVSPGHRKHSPVVMKLSPIRRQLAIIWHRSGQRVALRIVESELDIVSGDVEQRITAQHKWDGERVKELDGVRVPIRKSKIEWHCW